jgi:hypothetical protein
MYSSLDRGSAYRKGLPVQDSTHSKNEDKRIYICWLGFETKIVILEESKSVWAFCLTATVIGSYKNKNENSVYVYIYIYTY